MLGSVIGYRPDSVNMRLGIGNGQRRKALHDVLQIALNNPRPKGDWNMPE